MSALEGIADELAEASHVADVPIADILRTQVLDLLTLISFQCSRAYSL
jgi:hypothetical protein